jgi:hypothetical protein
MRREKFRLAVGRSRDPNPNHIQGLFMYLHRRDPKTNTDYSERFELKSSAPATGDISSSFNM